MYSGLSYVHPYWMEWMRVASLTMFPLPTLMNTDFCACVHEKSTI